MDITQIDEGLTPDQAYESCLEWVKDISKEDFEKIKTDKSLFFGQPQKQDSNQIGVYKVVDFLPIDYTLNPNNASERGFEWVTDVLESDAIAKIVNMELGSRMGYKYSTIDPSLADWINPVDNTSYIQPSTQDVKSLILCYVGRKMNVPNDILALKTFGLKDVSQLNTVCP